MILYQLAKWMEELTRIRRTIKQSDGDVTFLVYREEQVQRQLLSHAGQWLNMSGIPSVNNLEALPEAVSWTELAEMGEQQEISV